jgi:hypothetical protein
MTASLTTLITRAQATLGDDGTLFTTAMLTAAARLALSDFNERAPVHVATTIVGVNNQYEYELSNLDVLAISIIDVLERGADNNELDVSLTYDDYSEDERLFFRLRAPVTSTDTLIVRYTIPQTINGLDSSVESTISDQQDTTLLNGICYHALCSRAAKRVESINLAPAVVANYEALKKTFNTQFQRGLAKAAEKRGAVGEPDTKHWPA